MRRHAVSPLLVKSRGHFQRAAVIGKAKKRAAGPAPVTAGLTAPATAILIFACARWHGADIEAVDTQFEELAKF
jgi:hypothetical protein